MGYVAHVGDALKLGGRWEDGIKMITAEID